MTQDQIKDAIVRVVTARPGRPMMDLHMAAQSELNKFLTSDEISEGILIAIEQGLITPKDGKLYPATKEERGSADWGDSYRPNR